MTNERIEIIELVTESCNSCARQSMACEIIGIASKTFQRWCKAGNQQDGRIDPSHMPVNKLTEHERQLIISTANEEKYNALSPSKIVPLLADEGRYIASESSFRRVLKAEKQLKHRAKSKLVRVIKKPRALTATTPNQVFSWDIT